MNIVIWVSILILFALWMIAEVRCDKYKKDCNEYKDLYETAKDLCNEQIKRNDENMEFLNQMLERLYQMDKESKAEWESLKKKLDDLEVARMTELLNGSMKDNSGLDKE